MKFIGTTLEVKGHEFFLMMKKREIGEGRDIKFKYK